jgi:hypothetical protein
MKYARWLLYAVVIFFAFYIGANIAQKVEKVLPKSTKGTYQIKTNTDGAMKLDVQRFAIETVNARGDKKIPTISGTITATQDIPRGTVQSVTLTTTPDLIKAPSRKCAIVALAYPASIEPGFSYEVTTFGDVLNFFKINNNNDFYDIGLNVGFTRYSSFATVSKILSPSFAIYLGTSRFEAQSCMVGGVGVRF